MSESGRPVRRYGLAAAALVASSLLLVVGASPVQAAPGRAYVSSSRANTVSVVDTATNAIVTTIPIGHGPDGLAVTPDGSRVYVANADGTVSVIDTASNTVVATVTVGGRPSWVTIAPDGTRAWVTGFDRTSVVDTASNTVVGTVPAL